MAGSLEEEFIGQKAKVLLLFCFFLSGFPPGDDYQRNAAHTPTHAHTHTCTYKMSTLKEHRGLLKLNYPMEHGIVTDEADMKKIWNHVYQKLLNVQPEGEAPKGISPFLSPPPRFFT